MADQSTVSVRPHGPPFGAVDAGAAAAVILIWAFNFIAAKVGVAQLPPLLLLTLRFGLVALLLSPFLRRRPQRFGLVFLLSLVLGVLHFGPLFVGISRVNAGPAAIAIQLTVPFSALLAWIIFRERLSIAQGVGMAIAFVGVYVLAGEPASAPDTGYFLMVVGAAFAWSVANIVIKKVGKINVFTLNAWMAFLACPQLALASLVFEHHQWEAIRNADIRGWAAVAYTAIGASIIAYGLWYYLIRKHEVNRVVPLTLLSPVVAVALAVLILDDPLTLRIVVGGVITLVGVAMIQFLQRRPIAVST